MQPQNRLKINKYAKRHLWIEKKKCYLAPEEL